MSLSCTQNQEKRKQEFELERFRAIEEMLSEADINAMRPVEALTFLDVLKQKLQ